MDLEQTGGHEIDLNWRTAHYLHDPVWAGRSLMLKICCVRVYVRVSVTWTEALETAEHIGITGVKVVYRAPLTAGVPVLMNHKTQNHHLLKVLTDTYAMKKVMKGVFLLKLGAAAWPVWAALASISLWGLWWETDICSGVGQVFLIISWKSPSICLDCLTFISICSNCAQQDSGCPYGADKTGSFW